MQDLDYTIVFKPGTQIPHIDALSRDIIECIRKIMTSRCNNMDVDVVNTFSESVFITSQRKMTIFIRAWDKYDSIVKVSPDLALHKVEIGKINPKKWDNFVVKVDGKMHHRLYNNRNSCTRRLLSRNIKRNS